MNTHTDVERAAGQALTEDVFGAKDSVFRKEPGEYMTAQEQARWRDAYEAEARTLYLDHFRQNREQALGLRDKYRTPIFGIVPVIDVLRRLAECIDPTDTELYCVNQLVHTLQVAGGMEQDGITDETLILAALLHDMGKVTELVGEVPEYVNGPNEPIGDHAAGCGLDNVLTTWNHDEFAYQRVRAYVPDHVAWLIRHHSLRFDLCMDLMDARDRRYFDTYLGLFRKYDLGTKSVFNRPQKRLSDYEALVRSYFPAPIAI
jgi:predicted HD phosphohydrolase